jgi:NADPH-dependent 7-cyano-7-deazaguanine reductase QueF-like protein
MKYYGIRTNDQVTVNNLINNNIQEFSIDNLSWYQNEVAINDIVFIKISGDDAKKNYGYDNALKAIGRIVSLPYNVHIPANRSTDHYTIDIAVDLIFNDVITANDLYIYPDVLNSMSIGASTKGMPNQAIGQLNSDNKGEYLIKALIDLGYLNNQNNIILNQFNIINNQLKKCTIGTIQV